MAVVYLCIFPCRNKATLISEVEIDIFIPNSNANLYAGIKSLVVY